MTTAGSDIANLVASISVEGGPDALTFVTSAAGAALLASVPDVVENERIATFPLVVTSAAGDRLIAIDGSRIATSDGGVIVEKSAASALQLSDSPVSGTPAAMASMFQTNTVALRVQRYASWLQLRDDATGFVVLPVGGALQVA